MHDFVKFPKSEVALLLASSVSIEKVEDLVKIQNIAITGQLIIMQILSNVVSFFHTR